MRIIQFNRSDFNCEAVDGNVTRPKNVIEKMSSALLPSAPDGSYTTENYDNSFIIFSGDRQVEISAWQFKLNDWKHSDLFKVFREDDSDTVIVFTVDFYDDCRGEYDSTVNDVACAFGFNSSEINKALFMIGTKSMMWARQFTHAVKTFLTPYNDIIDAICTAMPNGSDVKHDSISLSGTVPVNDYSVKISAYDKHGNVDFTATISHKYTMDDAVYGRQFSNTYKSIKFSSVKDVEAYNWSELWDYLYENRHGTCTYSGSLGS